MTPISERLRNFAQGCRGSMWQSRDKTIGLMDESAHTIDALTEALVEAREQITILQDRLGIKDTGHGTLSIIDAALASIKGGQ